MAIKLHISRRASVSDDDPPNLQNMKAWDIRRNNQQQIEEEDNDDDEHSHLFFFNENNMAQVFYNKFNLAYDTIMGEIQPLRDVWDGLRSAFTLSWTGYYEGFNGLVYEFPWEGFQQGGVVGLLAGTTAGIVHFTSMTTSGVAAGLYQAVRGIERTFVAVKAAKDGMIWSNSRKEWFFYSLDEEATTIDYDSSSSSSSSSFTSETMQTNRNLRKRVKDRRFYEILNISTDANTTEIKRAYYQRALSVHPDKSSESEALDQFRELNTAYRTLITQESRDLYDNHGICYAEYIPSEQTAKVDPYTFFSILFGTGVIESYVGNLAVASIVDNILHLTDNAESGSFHDSGYSSPQQVRRQIDIASHLRFRIQNYTDGMITFDQFTASCRAETESLAMAMEDTVQAEFLLSAISSGMIDASSEYIMASWARPLAAVFGNSFLDGAKHFKVAHDLEREIKKALGEAIGGDDDDDEESNRSAPDECNMDSNIDRLLLHLGVPKTMKLVWKFNANDITRSVRESCKRVIDDSAGNHEQRIKRAKALNTLGREFYSAIKLRQKVIGDDKWVFPEASEIQESVRLALLEAIVNDSRD